MRGGGRGGGIGGGRGRGGGRGEALDEERGRKREGEDLDISTEVGEGAGAAGSCQVVVHPPEREGGRTLGQLGGRIGWSDSK